MVAILLLIGLCLYFTYTDLKSRIIPNRVIYPALLIASIWRLLEPSFLLGLIPALVLFLIYFIHPPCIGEGDIKLFALIGLILGLYQMWPMLFFTGLCVFVFGIVVIFMRKLPIRKVPMAPFITVGVILTVLLNTNHI